MTTPSVKLKSKVMGDVDNKIAPIVDNKSVETIVVTLKRDTMHKGSLYKSWSKMIIEKSQLPNFSWLIVCEDWACEVCK